MKDLLDEFSCPAQRHTHRAAGWTDRW